MADGAMSQSPYRHWVLMITEMRRVPQMSYKSDITVLSGERMNE